MNLNTLCLNDNELEGSVPSTIAQLQQLSWLCLSHNSLIANLGDLSPLYNLIKLELSSNNLSGAIPPSISGLRQVVTLKLDNNALESPTPRSLSALSHLYILDLSRNKFSEDFPTVLTQMTQVGNMKLSNNNFTGSIPASITSLASLTYLDLGYTLLSGTIPTAFTKMHTSLTLTFAYQHSQAPSRPPWAPCSICKQFMSTTVRLHAVLGGARWCSTLAQPSAMPAPISATRALDGLPPLRSAGRSAVPAHSSPARAASAFPSSATAKVTSASDAHASTCMAMHVMCGPSQFSIFSCIKTP
ncbi:unnamed protein product [Closterium sp. Yama58-4]|nr:unnamed protein product [Closterium sp. Yama58-4]